MDEAEISLKKVKIFLHAINTGTGGGLTLLNELALALGELKPALRAQIDSRVCFRVPQWPKLEIDYINPNLLNRFTAEVNLRLKNINFDLILCFGSLPPLFKIKGNVVIFLQNRYLIDNISLSGFSLKTKLKILIERFWLKYRTQKSYKYIVQTKSMKYLLMKNISINANNILIQPLFNTSDLKVCLPKDNIYDFIYVASGEPHKNHIKLIDAWVILANKNIYPSLCLTLDPVIYKSVLDEVEKLKVEHNLQIFNVGHVSNEAIYLHYASSGALIFPSLLESFGLPLIEAGKVGIPILASEMDYVRDVISPSQSFDPNSSLSISRAVERFLGVHLDINEPISGKKFIQNIYSLFN
jgi:glycosyltransferase involved in cell wall biosynthesis